MGRLADQVLNRGGRIIGVMPDFMRSVEWAHQQVKEFHFVADMHERKKAFLTGIDALIALPGGCGTLEELLEAITLRRSLWLLNTDKCGRLLTIESSDASHPTSINLGS